jgi:lysine-N-methylase
VLIPAIPDQRWSCHTCGECCRRLVGHLFEHERQRLDQQGWADELGIAPYVRAGRNWVLNKRPDGACVFLDEKNLCRIHAKFGESAKPLACRVFPFSLRPAEGGWQASLRFDCPSVTSSRGEPIRQHAAFLKDLASELPSDGRFAEGGVRHRPVEPVYFYRRLAAEPQETDALCKRLVRWNARGCARCAGGALPS